MNKKALFDVKINSIELVSINILSKKLVAELSLSLNGKK